MMSKTRDGKTLKEEDRMMQDAELRDAGNH
jgi:hypothetical protein